MNEAEKMREALEPFAKAEWTGLRSAASGTPLPDREVFEVDGLKVGDFNRAREALAAWDARVGVGELRAEMRRVAGDLHKTAPGGVSYAGTLLEKGAALL